MGAAAGAIALEVAATASVEEATASAAVVTPWVEAVASVVAHVALEAEEAMVADTQAEDTVAPIAAATDTEGATDMAAAMGAAMVIVAAGATGEASALVWDIGLDITIHIGTAILRTTGIPTTDTHMDIPTITRPVLPITIRMPTMIHRQIRRHLSSNSSTTRPNRISTNSELFLSVRQRLRRRTPMHISATESGTTSGISS